MSTQDAKVVSMFGELRVEEIISANINLLNNGQVLIDGYAIPHLSVRGVQVENGVVAYHITLDSRFGYFASGKDQLAAMVHLAADSMAIARGYSSFGKNLRPMNEFNDRPFGFIDSIKG